MKKLIMILTLMMSANALALDLVQLPFHLISNNDSRSFKFIEGLSDKMSEEDNPFNIAILAFLSPFALLNEETGYMEASTEQLKAQGYTDEELTEAQSQINNFANDHDGEEYASQDQLKQQLNEEISSEAARELLGLQ